jgi:gentisate 1,2-dioxygenase
MRKGAWCEAQRLDWEDKDVFTVPTWTFCEHVNSGDRPPSCSASATRR